MLINRDNLREVVSCKGKNISNPCRLNFLPLDGVN